MIYTIYKFENSVNGKIYIGFDSNYPSRIKIHKSAHKSQDSKFYRAIRKYGWENFKYEPIYQSKYKEHTLNIMENYFIGIYNSYKDGYNSTLGGDGCFGLILSDEAKIKISEGNKIKPKQTQEWIDSRIHNGLKTRIMKKEQGFDYTLTDEHKNKISNSLKGIPRPFSEEHRISNKNHILKLNSIKIECPHCKKYGQKSNMLRWHFDNCKKLRP